MGNCFEKQERVLREQCNNLYTPARQNKEKQATPWTELLPELLEEIIKFLDIDDHIRVSVVCKAWRAAALVAHRPTTRFPWLLICPLRHRPHSSLHLYSPWENKDCLLPFPYGDTSLAINASPLGVSAAGWLLFFRRETSGERVHKFKPFFYHPFFRLRIDLPCLNLSNGCLKRAMFSSTPASTSCIIVAFSGEHLSPKIHVCRRGDSEWVSRASAPDLSLWQGPLFSKGNFYFFRYQEHAVMEFDAVDGGWKHYSLVHTDAPHIRFRFFSRSDGELGAVRSTTQGNKFFAIVKQGCSGMVCLPEGEKMRLERAPALLFMGRTTAVRFGREVDYERFIFNLKSQEFCCRDDQLDATNSNDRNLWNFIFNARLLTSPESLQLPSREWLQWDYTG